VYTYISILAGTAAGYYFPGKAAAKKAHRDKIGSRQLFAAPTKSFPGQQKETHSTSFILLFTHRSKCINIYDVINRATRLFSYLPSQQQLKNETRQYDNFYGLNIELLYKTAAVRTSKERFPKLTSREITNFYFFIPTQIGYLSNHFKIGNKF